MSVMSPFRKIKNSFKCDYSFMRIVLRLPRIAWQPRTHGLIWDHRCYLFVERDYPEYKTADVVPRENDGSMGSSTYSTYVLLRAKKVGHQTSVSFKKFDVLSSSFIVILPLIIVIEIWHYSSSQSKNLFYVRLYYNSWFMISFIVHKLSVYGLVHKDIGPSNKYIFRVGVGDILILLTV
jgi:hypothetical protein